MIIRKRKKGTHIQGSVLIIGVLQSQCSFLQLLSLVGQSMFRLIKLKAFTGEPTAALNDLTLLHGQTKEEEN